MKQRVRCSLPQRASRLVRVRRPRCDRPFLVHRLAGDVPPFFVGLLLSAGTSRRGRSLGRVVALKRSFQDFKSQIDRDGEIGDVKQAIPKTAREVKNVAKVPRAVSDPGSALRTRTHEAMSSPVEDDELEVGVARMSR